MTAQVQHLARSPATVLPHVRHTAAQMGMRLGGHFFPRIIMLFVQFLSDDAAAVTVDYTWLTAMIIIVGLGLLVSLRAGVLDMAETTGTVLDAAEVVQIGQLN
jgi:hypothetical protein